MIPRTFRLPVRLATPANLLLRVTVLGVNVALLGVDHLRSTLASCDPYVDEENYPGANMSETLHPVEVAKIEAEKAKVEAETKLLRLRYQTDAIYLRQKQADEEDRGASDFANLVYLFDSEVTSNSARIARDTLMQWHRRFPDAPIEIVFASPGGSVFSGWMLYDTIRFLSRNGHKITTVAQGYAASMAGILLQAGDVRVIGHESYLMLHEVSTMALGKGSEIMDEAKLCERLTRQAALIFAERSNLTVEQIEDRLSRRDWWLNAQEALDLGFVDEIR